MIGLFERLVGLRDEGRGPLDALLAVGDLLGEFPNPLCLERTANAKRRQRTKSDQEFMNMPSNMLRCCR